MRNWWRCAHTILDLGFGWDPDLDLGFEWDLDLDLGFGLDLNIEK